VFSSLSNLSKTKKLFKQSAAQQIKQDASLKTFCDIILEYLQRIRKYSGEQLKVELKEEEELKTK